MTQSTSDPATAVPGGVASSGGATPLSMPGSAGASRGNGADARARIHRFAGAVHQAIDNIEHKLNARSRDAVSAQGRYGGQARQYGEKLREQINARPVQSAGIALGAGMVLHKLFSRTPKVRVVQVPVPTRTRWESSTSPDRRARSLVRGAEAHVQRLGMAGQRAADKARAAAGLGIAGTTAMGSRLTHKASEVPLQMRLAMQRLLARSQEYGSAARAGVQAHPMVGIGSALGLGALLTTFWLQRRRPASGVAYVAVDEDGNAVAWQRDRPEVRDRVIGMVESRPVASAVVMLGLGALVGAMLRRR